jgi:hypothetical protein
MNPVMALGMKQNAVRGTSGTAHHTGDTVMQAPARDPGTLSEGFERSVASPLQPRRLRATGRTVRSILSLSDNHFQQLYRSQLYKPTSHYHSGNLVAITSPLPTRSETLTSLPTMAIVGS